MPDHLWGENCYECFRGPGLLHVALADIKLLKAKDGLERLLLLPPSLQVLSL